MALTTTNDTTRMRIEMVRAAVFEGRVAHPGDQFSTTRAVGMGLVNSGKAIQVEGSTDPDETQAGADLPPDQREDGKLVNVRITRACIVKGHPVPADTTGPLPIGIARVLVAGNKAVILDDVEAGDDADEDAGDGNGDGKGKAGKAAGKGKAGKAAGKAAAAPVEGGAAPVEGGAATVAGASGSGDAGASGSGDAGASGSLI